MPKPKVARNLDDLISGDLQDPPAVTNQQPPRTIRAPRSDKGAPRMPPSAVEVIKKRQAWVLERLAKITPEYQSLEAEAKRNQAALDALDTIIP